MEKGNGYLSPKIKDLKYEDVVNEGNPFLLTAICPNCEGWAGTQPSVYVVKTRTTSLYNSITYKTTKRILHCKVCKDDGFLYIFKNGNYRINKESRESIERNGILGNRKLGITIDAER